MDMQIRIIWNIGMDYANQSTKLSNTQEGSPCPQSLHKDAAKDKYSAGISIDSIAKRCPDNVESV